LNEAAAYYHDILGFNIDWGGEDGGIMGISRGDCRIFLTTEEFRDHYQNVGRVLVWINLDNKEEVNMLFEVWSGNEAKIVSLPESKAWGLYEFTVSDIDGNLFRVFYDFATPQRQREE
jgi:uncharacterized glyoxalase superfamily protein PhnB